MHRQRSRHLCAGRENTCYKYVVFHCAGRADSVLSGHLLFLVLGVLLYLEYVLLFSVIVNRVDVSPGALLEMPREGPGVGLPLHSPECSVTHSVGAARKHCF